MRTGVNSVDASPAATPSLSDFLEEKAGASMYEFALLASLVAVVSIIILIALSLDW